MKFQIYTLGCKVNTYESEMMKEKMLASGYVYDEENPDIIIVNTCSVTNMADHKSQKMVRHFKRNNPQALLVVCGCSSENDPKPYEELGIDILLGNNKKSEIVSLIEQYIKTHEPYTYFAGTRKLPFEDMQIAQFKTHTRAFVKIEDGCDNFCSYCVIPLVRGSIRHKDFDIVVEEVKTLVLHGHQEIVFTGIHTGSYHSNGHDLTDLIHEVSQIDGLKCIRISSIEMTELDDKFLNELRDNPKICNHLHIPLQAGTNEILKRMNRKYSVFEFKRKIAKIRDIRPDISISTDIIVGFPGETNELFEQTLMVARELQFSKIHVFPYSVRKNTKAALMDNQVDEKEKHERSKKLVALSKELEEEYAKRFIGQTLDVLIEKNGKESIGTTSNYLKVRIMEDIGKNKIVQLKIICYEKGILIGERIACKV